MLAGVKRDPAEVMRDEFVVRHEIASFLADGPRTIPEIAQHLGHPAHEVVIWVMAMWKYGVLTVTGEIDDDGYSRYELKE